MSVSIHDVAKKASLSCETILEVLISPSSSEPEVVRFVMKTIRETGYLETFARWKTNKRGTSVAVITSMMESASGMEVFKGIDRVMSALGLNTTMLVLPERFPNALREEFLATLVPANMLDAIITVNIVPDEMMVAGLNKIGKPLVVMQTNVAGAQSVLLENQKGMAIGINYLYGKGYRRIALVNGPAGTTDSVPSERMVGYLTAMHRHGLEFDESLVYETTDFDTESGVRSFEYFYAKGKLPDAIFCAAGDMAAIGFINAAREKGIRVPEDIAVLGYDDLPIAALVYPGLTTIRQRLMIAGAGALVLALESAVNGQGKNLVIVPELVVRETA
jgi:LacI family transcriptional regulator